MTNIAVIGLGYVGLPLAVAFSRHYPTVGYDKDAIRVRQCRNRIDATGEIQAQKFDEAGQLSFSDDPAQLAGNDVFIVAVPTPVDAAKRTDFSPLVASCETVGPVIKSGSVIVFESTVYPGVTEEMCVPVLERASGLCWKTDFNVAYSPERVNAGDKQHNLQNIVKRVVADDDITLRLVTDLYGKIIAAGVYEVESIRLAEAAKVIENTQRDFNISLVNELAIIFDRLGLDTTKFLEAASTKWNFLPFRPGLVGGHCIGVDPYYLIYKAQMVGYHPEVILAGRRINDGMGRFVAERTVKTMAAVGM